jgi:hypothetical protein
MDAVLYEPGSGWSFVILTLALGGGTAYMTGRAVAQHWRPLWTLFGYVVLLAGALRFLHFALFDGAFFSLSAAEKNLAAVYFTSVDYMLLTAAALLGWRITRTSQMTRQYGWLYEKTSPFTWKDRMGAKPETRASALPNDRPQT